jgi:hypothetical protein
MATELDADGFVVLPRAVRATDAALREASVHAARRAQRIFNGERRNDGRRRQAHLDGALKRWSSLATLTRDAEDAVARVVQADATEWVVLQSLAGCAEQAPHSDYEPDAAMRRAAASGEGLPHFCVVALQPGTRLVVWKGSHRVLLPRRPALQEGPRVAKRVAKRARVSPPRRPVERVELALEPGDVVIVRGDCVHAGAAYETDNVRLHAFLDTRAVPRTANRTYRIDRKAVSDGVLEAILGDN